MAHIKAIKDMYDGAKTHNKTLRGNLILFFIAIMCTRDHSLAHSSPFFITLVMDELTRHIQIEVLWYMLFTNNIVMIDK